MRFSARPGSWSSGFLASWRLECIYRSDPFAVVASSSHQVDSENHTAKRSCNAFSEMVFLSIHAFPCILAPSTLTSLPIHISLNHRYSPTLVVSSFHIVMPRRSGRASQAGQLSTQTADPEYQRWLCWRTCIFWLRNTSWSVLKEILNYPTGHLFSMMLPTLSGLSFFFDAARKTYEKHSRLRRPYSQTTSKRTVTQMLACRDQQPYMEAHV